MVGDVILDLFSIFLTLPLYLSLYLPLYLSLYPHPLPGLLSQLAREKGWGGWAVVWEPGHLHPQQMVSLLFQPAYIIRDMERKTRREDQKTSAA